MKIPELAIEAKGSSGIEIRAKLPEQFNCVEFTLRDDIPQPVFISPWMQFEPAKMNDYRLKLAYEIARRAAAHDQLVEQVESLQKSLRFEQEARGKCMEEQWAIYALWREERVKAGLPEDFNDLRDEINTIYGIGKNPCDRREAGKGV